MMATLRLIGFLVLAGLFTCPALADGPLAAAGIMAREFKIRVLFFFSRNMLISLENKAFEHTHVESKIVGQQ